MIHFGKELPALLRTQKQRESIQKQNPSFQKAKRDRRPASKSFGSERKKDFGKNCSENKLF